jgi:hypothetical protein
MKFKELREKYRSKYPSSLVATAVKIAIDMGGNMTGAYKKIEKMKKGLADDPMVADALKQANESVNEGLKKSGKGTVDVDYIGDSSLTKKLEKKFKVKIKQTGRTTADISGDYKNIIKLLKSDAYLMDEDEIEDTYSELGENVIKENVKAVMRKHKKHIDKWKRSSKPMPIQVEDELMQAAMKAGEIKTDDPEEFDNWLDRNL